MVSDSHYLKRELDELLAQQHPDVMALLKEGSARDLYLWDIEQPDNLWTSPSFWQALGYDPAERSHARSELQKLVDARDLASAQRDADLLIDARAPTYDQVVRFRHRAGHALWFRSHARALRDEHGKARRVVGIRVNLTDLLMGRDERFRLVVESVPTAIVVVDRQGSIQLVNARACELLGYERIELMEMSISSLVPAQVRDVHAQHVERFFDEGRPRRMAPGRELSVLRKDGSELPVEISLSPMEAAGAQLTVATIEDLTERKRAQSARERLAAIVDSSPDAIVSTTLTGTVTSWNRAAERLFGLTAIEVLGRSFIDSFIPADRQLDSKAVFARVAKGEVITALETVFVNQAGQDLDVAITLAPLRDMHGHFEAVSAIIRDIRQRKARERALERSNAELEQFAYIASHDLQEPLRTVANYTELISSRYSGKLDANADRYLRFASDAARRMQQMVSDLLAYSRVASTPQALTEVTLDSVVQHAVLALNRVTKETQATFDIAPLPKVQGMHSLLVQLFQNLLGNALKYRHRDRAPHVVIRTRSTPDKHYFSVQDNGIGFDMAHAQRLFQMFQRLHARSEYEGTGIGLAIAKRIVERHGGSIWVESQTGVGSTFYFTLSRVHHQHER